METKRVAPDAVQIIRMPHGGFMVHEAAREDGFYRSYLFASSTIEDAFKFVKKYLELGR